MSKQTTELELKKWKLEQVKKHHEAGVLDWKKKLADAKTNGVRGTVLTTLKEQHDTWYSMSQSTIEHLEGEIKTLQSEIGAEMSQMQQAARAELDVLKEERRQAWILQGGTSKSFDEVWPSMELQILMERTAAVGEKDPVVVRQRDYSRLF